MSAPRLEELAPWTRRLPTLPEVVHYLMRAIGDEGALHTYGLGSTDRQE